MLIQFEYNIKEKWIIHGYSIFSPITICHWPTIPADSSTLLCNPCRTSSNLPVLLNQLSTILVNPKCHCLRSYRSPPICCVPYLWMYHPSWPFPMTLKTNARCHQIYSLGPSHTDNTSPADCHIGWLNLPVSHILICNDGSPVPLEGDQLMPINSRMYADPIATSLPDSQNLLVCLTCYLTTPASALGMLVEHIFCPWLYHSICQCTIQARSPFSVCCWPIIPAGSSTQLCNQCWTPNWTSNHYPTGTLGILQICILQYSV